MARHHGVHRIRALFQHVQGGAVVVERVLGREVEERHQRIREHVAGDEHARIFDEQRCVAGGVRAMLDDADARAGPGEALCTGGEGRDRTQELHRDVGGVLGRQVVGELALPVVVREELADGGSAGRGAEARCVAERGMPQHVVPVGMGGEGGDHRQPARLQVVGDAGELGSGDAGIDEQRAVVAADDDRVALDALALMDEHAVGDLLQHGRAHAGSTVRRMTVFFIPLERMCWKPASSYIERVPL